MIFRARKLKKIAFRNKVIKILHKIYKNKNSVKLYKSK